MRHVTTLVFEVARDDLSKTRTMDERTELVDGDVVLRVDEFAHTTNNLTYARLGDTVGYWKYFPSSDDRWGRIPTWGNVTVVASRHPGVEEGARFYGLVPMADHLVARPERISDRGFVDSAPPRAGLSPVYNAYRRLPARSAVSDQLRPVLEPVLYLAFVLDLALTQTGDAFVLITSASSKAAVSTAWLLHRRHVAVTGLTSPEHDVLCASLGCYDTTVDYGHLAELEARPTTVIDLSGNPSRLEAVRQHFGASLRRTIRAGLTDPSAPGGAIDAEFFSTPEHIVRWTRAWGRDAFERRVDEAFEAFVAWATDWITVAHTTSASELEQAHREVLDGTSQPSRVTLHRLVARDPVGVVPTAS